MVFIFVNASMLACGHVPTPIVHPVCLSATTGTQLSEEDEYSSYHKLIGCLLYLTNTRLDIVFSINNLI